HLGEGVDRPAAGHAGGLAVAGRPRGEHVGPAGGRLLVEARLPLARQLGVGGRPGTVRLGPGVGRGAAALHAAEVEVPAVVGTQERGVGGPADRLLGEPDLLLAQRRAVRLVAVLLVGAAVSDVGAAGDDRGPLVVLRRGDGGADGGGVV